MFSGVVAPDARPPAPRRLSYPTLLRPPYLRRSLLINGFGLCSAFAYSAIAFGLPSILANVLHEGVFGVLAASLALNLLFAFTGGLLGVRLTRSFPSLLLTAAGYVIQFTAAIVLALIGHPHGMVGVAVALAALAAFLFAQGFGPGCQCMVYPSLSYPTAMRGMGVGLARTISGIGATASLMVLPSLNAKLGTDNFWVVALAPMLGIAILLATRWEVFGYDADAEDAPHGLPASVPDEIGSAFYRPQQG